MNGGRSTEPEAHAPLDLSRTANGYDRFGFPGGIVNAATFGKAQALAPSTIAATFGNLLAPVTVGSAIPLPTKSRRTDSIDRGNRCTALVCEQWPGQRAEYSEGAPLEFRQQAFVKFDSGSGVGD